MILGRTSGLPDMVSKDPVRFVKGKISAGLRIWRPKAKALEVNSVFWCFFMLFLCLFVVVADLQPWTSSSNGCQGSYSSPAHKRLTLFSTFSPLLSACGICFADAHLKKKNASETCGLMWIMWLTSSYKIWTSWTLRFFNLDGLLQCTFGCYISVMATWPTSSPPTATKKTPAEVGAKKSTKTVELWRKPWEIGVGLFCFVFVLLFLFADCCVLVCLGLLCFWAWFDLFGIVLSPFGFCCFIFGPALLKRATSLRCFFVQHCL